MTVKELRKVLKKFNKKSVVMITNEKNVDFDSFEIGYSQSEFGFCKPKECDEVYLAVVTDKRD